MDLVSLVYQQWVDRLFFGGSQEALAQENARLRQELIRSERLKAVSTLAADLAHEIKNPLAAIKTFTEFLPERHEDPVFLEKFHRIDSRPGLGTTVRLELPALQEVPGPSPRGERA